MTDQVSMGAARAIVSTVVMIVSFAACETGDRQSSDTTRAAEVSGDTTAACASDNGGLTLPDGFAPPFSLTASGTRGTWRSRLTGWST